ncbi:unnamed protein product [Lymnaea stagnalis]|uniref:NOL1/NOP2/Sun domain family member 4 n=1 Tax=Lymnaea stagnalis TaxID=6523 RepID=A0AAV2IDI7_LYMST
MSLYIVPKHILRVKYLLSALCIPRRHRYKNKWAVNLKKEPNCQLALNNFDAFYRPYYGAEWPSVRISLLSMPKYCAVLNKYGHEEKIESQLGDLTLLNFTEYARYFQQKKIKNNQNGATLELKSESKEVPVVSKNKKLSFNPQMTKVYPDETHLKETAYKADIEVLEPYKEELYKDNLNVFVPTEQVYSEKEQIIKEEMSINAFQPRDIGINIIQPKSVNISRFVDAFVFPKGDISQFPQPRPRYGIHGYYLMDAASVMPVLALDVQPRDNVLDLCAAPGGKTFTILQSLDLESGGSLICNDLSQSRLNRLKNVLSSHFPPDISEQVVITKKNGIEALTPVFDKVLVDVPCNADRHVVTEDDNNLFKISRTHERLSLMEIQKELLLSAIKSCVRGGTIVYSTCTLSPAQNDGVIQAALEELWETSEIEVAVEDLTSLADLFQDVFKFHKQSKYGKVILPNLLNNFGPSYFAKLKRIK